MGIIEEQIKELERLAKIGTDFLNQIENISAMFGFEETGHEEYWTTTINDILDEIIDEIREAMR